MAASCAAAFGAERLLFLTDVEGVLDGERRRIDRMTRRQSEALIQSGVASGGMQAKLEAVHAALDGGVGSISIAAGAQPGTIAKLLNGDAIGTRVTA
jgi:acetylglutamate kinase